MIPLTPNEALDLDLLLGVTFDAPSPAPRKARKERIVECGQAPPILRHVVEHHNLRTFEFTGYVAKVRRITCQCCEGVWDHLEGIFIEERHLPSGTRRLQQMGQRGDWPAAGGHRKEVEVGTVPYCGGCIGDLGFDREVDSKGQPWTLLIKE